MPKRLNPFGESSVPQLKNHIGVREVDLGVNMEQNMKLVYERTLNIMYKASQSQKENVGPNKRELSKVQRSLVLPGQCKLNLSGKLDGYYTKHQAEEMEHHFMPITCSSCSILPQTPRTCQFCEKSLCEMCSKDCGQCKNVYCVDCSTTRYVHLEEKTVCFSCI